MGLFGLFYGLFVGGMWIKDSVENEVYKAEDKVRSAKEGYATYYDKHGKEYFVDKQVHRSINKLMPDGTLHDVIIDLKTLKIIKDFTQERIDQFFIERDNIIKNAKKNGDLYYVIKAPNELRSNDHVYEKVLKGYCGSFETENDRRYNLAIDRNKSTNWKPVFKKYYYSEWEYKVSYAYYYQTNPIIISKEEYENWGGRNANNYDLRFIPKGGII